MESTTNLWQYIAVFAVLIVVFIWILVRLFSKKKSNKGGSCCGCALADTCCKLDKSGKNNKRVNSCNTRK